MLKGCSIHMTIKIQANSLWRIKLRRAPDERVGGRPGANISDSPRGAIVPGSKALALVGNISGNHSGGWR